VLVHQDGPLLGSEFAEEGVGLRGANGGATGGKAVDDGGETVLLSGEVAVVPHPLGGFAARLKPCPVTKHGRFRFAASQVSDLGTPGLC